MQRQSVHANDTESTRHPPQAVEIERSLLGAMMIEPRAIASVIGRLSGSDFYKVAHRDIFEACVELYSQQGEADLMLVHDRLKSKGQLEDAGGAHYLSELTSEVASPSSAGRYAAIIREKSMGREFIEAMQRMVSEAYDPSTDHLELIDKAERSIYQLANDRFEVPIQTMGEAVEEAYGLVKKYRDGEAADILHTGMWSLDDLIGGLQVGHMTVVAAPTSGYKTAFLVDLCKRLGKRFEKQDEPQAIVIFEAEMSARQMALRMACNEARVNKMLITPDSQGRTSAEPEVFDKLEAALEKLSNLRIYIDPTPSPTFQQMYSRVRQIGSEMPVRLAALDYLEKADVGSKATEEKRVSAIAEGMKGLAKRMDIPTVVLSQYKRGLTISGDKIPKYSMLRYSGRIEHEAQTVLHIFYPKYWIDREEQCNKYDPNEPNRVFIYCDKNRDGDTGWASMFLEEEYGRFVDPRERGRAELAW